MKVIEGYARDIQSTVVVLRVLAKLYYHFIFYQSIVLSLVFYCNFGYPLELSLEILVKLHLNLFN